MKECRAECCAIEARFTLCSSRRPRRRLPGNISAETALGAFLIYRSDVFYANLSLGHLRSERYTDWLWLHVDWRFLGRRASDRSCPQGRAAQRTNRVRRGHQLFRPCGYLLQWQIRRGLWRTMEGFTASAPANLFADQVRHSFWSATPLRLFLRTYHRLRRREPQALANGLCRRSLAPSPRPARGA